METNQQWLDLLRQILQVIGSLATTLGFLTVDQVATWTQIILQVSGPIMIIIGLVWGWRDNSKASIVSAAAAQPEVKTVLLNPSAPGTPALNAATPSNVTIQPPATASSGSRL